MNQPRRRRWHPLLTIIILLFFALTAWAVDQARKKVSPVSDNEYYSHGLHYDTGEDGKHGETAGGWTLTVKLEGQLLKATLHEADGSPVTGAKGEVVLLGSRPGEMKRLDLLFDEVDPGLYVIHFPADLKGQAMAQLTLEKGPVSLHRSLMLNF